jgi:hypothetical protein
LEQRPLKEEMASMASSDLSNCFITTAISFKALSTLSPAFIAFQNNTIAASGSFSTSYTIHGVCIKIMSHFLKIKIKKIMSHSPSPQLREEKWQLSERNLTWTMSIVHLYLKNVY